MLIQFYLGLTEQCNLGDSLSDSPKMYGQVRTYVILGKGVCAIKHSSSEKVYASLGGQIYVLKISMIL